MTSHSFTHAPLTFTHTFEDYMQHVVCSGLLYGSKINRNVKIAPQLHDKKLFVVAE